MINKTILITGATGFLGSHLTDKFVNEGFKVIILKRSFSNTWRINHLLDKIICYDIDKVDLSKPFEDHEVNTIIHTATKYGRNNERISEVLKSNLLFPIKLLEISISFNTDTFFNTDTVWTTPALYKYLNSYSLSKKQFGEWLKIFSDKIRVFNLKLENMYGEKDDTTRFIIPMVISQILKNEKEIKLTKGEQKRDFVYVKDVVDAYYRLFLKKDSFGKGFYDYNIGSGHPTKIREIITLIKKLIGNNVTYLNFEAIPYRENEIMELQSNVEKIKEDIGWEPKTSLEEGLKATVAWYRKQL